MYVYIYIYVYIYTHPLVNIQKAIEHGNLLWIYPLKMVIFHSYVSLPKGIYIYIIPWPVSPIELGHLGAV